MKAIILSLLVQTTPPGRTHYSVEVAADCAPSAEWCEGAKRSSFHGAWVRKESEATGARRYGVIAEVLDQEARVALCLGPEGKPICKQSKAQKRWTLEGLIAIAAAIGTYESGWRSDVAEGRGKSGKPADDGGEGRGPGGERCFMQVHPSVRDDDALLGSDREALAACFRQGLSMLVHARNYCAWAAPDADPTWATVALYGSGTDCYSINHGKTRLRVELARKFFAQIKRELRKP